MQPVGFCYLKFNGVNQSSFVPHLSTEEEVDGTPSHRRMSDYDDTSTSVNLQNAACKWFWVNVEMNCDDYIESMYTYVLSRTSTRSAIGYNYAALIWVSCRIQDRKRS